MRTTYLWAILIIAAAVVWMLTGILGKPEPEIAQSLAKENTAISARREDAPAHVRARVLRAVRQTEDVVVRATTMNKRMVEVKAMVGGRVSLSPVTQGRRVNTGDLLCQLDVADRRAYVAEAQAAVVQARLEYEGNVRLRARGYQSEMQEMTARARLASAIAGLQQRQIDLDRTSIRAPFAGVVEMRHAELGAFLQPGQLCVTLVAPDPMLISTKSVAAMTLLVRVNDTLAPAASAALCSVTCPDALLSVTPVALLVACATAPPDPAP